MTDSLITFDAVTESDFDALVQVRIDAMRESLERLGRFDPARARDRLRKTFAPASTEWILVGGERAGFYAMRKVDDHFSLDHLYVIPRFQRRGIGSHVMDRLKARATGERVMIVVGALRGSDSNRFYLREGFTKTSEDEWDIYYTFRHDNVQRT